jgi:hypothetical protein
MPRRLRTPEERFWSNTDKRSPDECWMWRGTIRQSGGYGVVRLQDSARPYSIAAHKFAYELLVGPVPEGLVLDHLCRVPSCVNPAHLEPVTNAENIHRGAIAQAYCRNGGHLRPLERRGRHLKCLECKRERNLARVQCEDCGSTRAFGNLRKVEGRWICRPYLRCVASVLKVEAA